MVQLKIFRFNIHNRICSDLDEDKKMAWYIRENERLNSIGEVENIVNDFLSTHRIINVETSILTTRINENKARDNGIDIIYSILYDTPERAPINPPRNRKIEDYCVTENSELLNMSEIEKLKNTNQYYVEENRYSLNDNVFDTDNSTFRMRKNQNNEYM